MRGHAALVKGSVFYFCVLETHHPTARRREHPPNFSRQPIKREHTSPLAMSKKPAAGNEQRVAMTELIGELDRTRKEFAKATLQLTQLETQVQHLKDAELRKDHAVAALEQDLERGELHHRQEVAVLQEEFHTKDAAWAHRVRALELDVARLQEENQALALFEKENRQLRETVLEHQSTIERLQLINEDLRSRAKNDTHEHAAVLEAEFKRRLADAEKRFRAEAYRALSEEAKLALQGNDHLQSVLQRQNDSIEAVLLRCKQLEHAHAKIQGEQEASTQNLGHHMTEVQRLKKQLGEARTKNTQLDDQLRQRKVERASLELLYVEYEATRKQLAKATEKSRRAVREAERWRNRAIQLTQELGDEQQPAGEARLRTLQAQSDRIEGNVQRRRVRSAQRQRERQRIAAGAAALRSAEGDLGSGLDSAGGDNSGDDDAYSQISDQDVTGAAVERHVRAVNPMDILAMWNVNFQSWRPGGAGAAGAAAASVAGASRAAGDPALEGSDAGGGAAGGDTGESPTRGGGAAAAPAAAASAAAPPIGASSSASVHDAADRGVTPRSVLAELRAHALGGSRGGGGGAVRSPTRPPARVEDVRGRMDRNLSVLAKPKASASAPALRAFGGGDASGARGARVADHSGGGIVGQKLSLASELTIVTHGDFKLARRAVKQPEQQRFLVP